MASRFRISMRSWFEILNYGNRKENNPHKKTRERN